MTTATLDNLTLAAVRDESNTLEALAGRHGTSEPYMAGVIDAVTGTDEWYEAVDWCEESEWVRREYRAGYQTGRAMLDAESYADGWAECYAIAAVEAAQLADPLPVGADDCPF